MSIDVFDGTFAEQIRGIIRHLFPGHLITIAEVEVAIELFCEVVGPRRVLTVKGVKPSVVRSLVQVAETLENTAKVNHVGEEGGKNEETAGSQCKKKNKGEGGSS